MRRRQVSAIAIAAVIASGVTAGAQAPALVSGPISTRATVEITDTHDKPIPLRPQEKIAVMFLSAIASMENDCRNHLGRVCALDELVQGVVSPSWRIGKLKFDPAVDPSYRYTLEISPRGWQAHADPLRPGLGGLLYDASTPMVRYYYNDTGPATPQSRQFAGVAIDGDIFNAR